MIIAIILFSAGNQLYDLYNQCWGCWSKNVWWELRTKLVTCVTWVIHGTCWTTFVFMCEFKSDCLACCHISHFISSMNSNATGACAEAKKTLSSCYIVFLLTPSPGANTTRSFLLKVFPISNWNRSEYISMQTQIYKVLFHKMFDRYL